VPTATVSEDPNHYQTTSVESIESTASRFSIHSRTYGRSFTYSRPTLSCFFALHSSAGKPRRRTLRGALRSLPSASCSNRATYRTCCRKEDESASSSVANSQVRPPRPPDCRSAELRWWRLDVGRWKCRTWHCRTWQWRTSSITLSFCSVGQAANWCSFLQFAVSGRKPPAEFDVLETLPRNGVVRPTTKMQV